MKREKSCGTVLFTVKDGTVYYLLICSPCRNIVGFPKGHMEKGESERDTALRETREETCIEATIRGKFRYDISYPLKNGARKTVVYFTASYEGQTPHSDPRYEQYNFVSLPFEEAYEALTYENTKRVLAEADRYIRGKILKPKDDNC